MIGNPHLAKVLFLSFASPKNVHWIAVGALASKGEELLKGPLLADAPLGGKTCFFYSFLLDCGSHYPWFQANNSI